MAANYSESFVLSASQEQVFSVLGDMNFLSCVKLTPHSQFPEANGGRTFHFRSGVTFSSWGENVQIAAYALSPVTTQVTVRSECSLPTQIIDWGKNKSNVKSIHAQLSSIAGSQPAAPAPVAAPAPAPVTAPHFCGNCGTKLDEAAVFCPTCGTKVR